MISKETNEITSTINPKSLRISYDEEILKKDKINQNGERSIERALA